MWGQNQEGCRKWMPTPQLPKRLSWTVAEQWVSLCASSLVFQPESGYARAVPISQQCSGSPTDTHIHSCLKTFSVSTKAQLSGLQAGAPCFRASRHCCFILEVQKLTAAGSHTVKGLAVLHCVFGGFRSAVSFVLSTLGMFLFGGFWVGF